MLYFSLYEIHPNQIVSHLGQRVPGELHGVEGVPFIGHIVDRLPRYRHLEQRYHPINNHML